MTRLATDSNGREYGIPIGRIGTTSYLTVPSGLINTPSHAFGPQTKLIRVAVENANARHIHFKIGVDPVCADDDAMLPMNTVEFFSVLPGEKIAFLHGQGVEVRVTVSEIL